MMNEHPEYVRHVRMGVLGALLRTVFYLLVIGLGVRLVLS